VSSVLPFRVRVRVIKTLVEGNSIRATSRLTGADKDVVMRFGKTVGLGCILLHQRLTHDVEADFIECDELWSFVRKKEKRKLKTDPRTWGDMYTMFALDAETKFVPAFATGKRTLVLSLKLADGVPLIPADGHRGACAGGVAGAMAIAERALAVSRGRWSPPGGRTPTA
jgi:hypothetical protein